MNKKDLKRLIKECILESYLEDNDYKYTASDGKVYKMNVEEDIEYQNGVPENRKNFHYITFPDGRKDSLDFSPYSSGGSEFKLWVELYIKTGGKMPTKNPNGGNWEVKDLKTFAEKLNLPIKEWGMSPCESVGNGGVDIKSLDIADLEKLLANPDPERAKDYGSMNNYKRMLQKKISSLKSGNVNEDKI